MNKNDKCVYLHLDVAGIIRYVGSGTKNRPYSCSSRNDKWKSIFSQHKPSVVIVESNLSKEDAISLEYYMYHSCLNSIVNTTEPRPPKSIDFKSLNEYFYVDETSPSGLRVKKKLPRNTSTNVGDPAGAEISAMGKKYWRVKHNGVSYYVHRIVYLLTNGVINSNLVINHIDGNGLNNSITNLEETTHQVNSFKRPKIKSTELPSGISYTKYKNKVDGFISKYTPVGETKQMVQRFSIVAFGSENKAFEAAKDWLDYYSQLNGWVIGDTDIELLRIKVIEHMRTIQMIRSNSKAYLTPNGKWTSRLSIKKGKNISCGVFDTHDEALFAKMKLIEEYNNSISIEL